LQYCIGTVGGAAAVAIGVTVPDPVTKASAITAASALSGWICSANCKG
jgi:hypothetical protein